MNDEPEFRSWVGPIPLIETAPVGARRAAVERFYSDGKDYPPHIRLTMAGKARSYFDQEYEPGVCLLGAMIGETIADKAQFTADLRVPGSTTMTSWLRENAGETGSVVEDDDPVRNAVRWFIGSFDDRMLSRAEAEIALGLGGDDDLR